MRCNEASCFSYSPEKKMRLLKSFKRCHHLDGFVQTSSKNKRTGMDYEYNAILM